MTFHSQAIPVFQHACACFKRLVDLTIPDDCRADLALFPETTKVVEVCLWQHKRPLFSLRLSADQTHQVVDHWQQFLECSSQEQQRLERPLTAQELRSLARSALLDLLLAIDDASLPKPQGRGQERLPSVVQSANLGHRTNAISKTGMVVIEDLTLLL